MQETHNSYTWSNFIPSYTYALSASLIMPKDFFPPALSLKIRSAYINKKSLESDNWTNRQL